MLRALIHYWRINVAVLLAVAVCAAVLTGALLVGDSVRGSLRDLTLDRLREIDLALVAERFFREELAADLAARADREGRLDQVAPALLLRGTVIHGDSRARASRVSVMGVDERFTGLFGDAPVSDAFLDGMAGRLPEGHRDAVRSEPELDLSRRDGQVFPSIVVNRTLADEIGAEAGDQVLVHFQLGSRIPRDTVLGRREAAETVGSLRAVVADVIPDVGIGRFDLSPHQGFPQNAFVALPSLQRAVEQPGRVNALLVSRDAGAEGAAGANAAAAAPDADTAGTDAGAAGGGAGAGGVAAATELLDAALSLEDLGLQVRVVDAAAGAVLQVESDEFVLRPAMVDAVEGAADALGAPTLPLQAYVANRMELDGRLLPYSMVMALDVPGETGAAGLPGDGPAPAGGGDHRSPFGTLRLTDGRRAPTPGDEEVLLNAWAAADLEAEVGDELRMTYYVVGADESLRTEARSFRVAGVVAMEGLAVDDELTPAYPGIEGSDDIAAWDPPFPVDLDLVRPVDEAYWDDHGATPKAFVNRDVGRRLWATRYGSTTSVRVGLPPDAEPAEFAAAYEAELLDRLDPERFGMRFLDVKAEGLRASSGATDFGGLFIGFSLFIIASAVMIVALLFSLGIEARAREIGTLLAVGYGQRAVRNRLLGEGTLIAAAGAGLGLVGAILYARLMMLGLRTLWLPAVGSPLLFLHVRPTTLATGWAAALVVVLASVAWTLRRLRRVPVRALLAGSATTGSGGGRTGRWTWITLAAAGLVGTGLFLFAVLTGRTTSPGVAFGIGASLLVLGLAAANVWLRHPRGTLDHAARAPTLAMALRNVGWNPRRSLLSLALVALATFVIVTVAANTRDPAGETEAIESGAGGYPLLATADVPLHQDLGNPDARFELGFPDDADELLADVEFTQLRLLPGDDASCLNLYQPRRPRLLGVPGSLIDRGGFRFGATLAAEHGVGDNPWRLLETDLGAGVVPAIGDANSTQWILHLGLGDELVMEDEDGDEIRLRIVGLLRESIFQSELLISEDRLREHFPSQSGFRYFLVDAPESRVEEVATMLESSLDRWGFDAVRSDDRIAGYLVVQNTYLSTFQMLGGLGLLLGTLGLGIVLVRNVIERRGELATLRAFGFRREFLGRTVLMENALLLTLGMLIGAVPALLAVMPRFLDGAVQVPWRTLLPTLGAVLVVGMLASVAAVAGALRIPLLPALKGDR